MENKLEKNVKKGVDFVFEQNHELVKVGTKEKYSEYLNFIFPESKVRDIVYHRSNNNFNKFKVGNHDYYGAGIYFIFDKDIASQYGEKIYPVILNIKNPNNVNSFNVAQFEFPISSKIRAYFKHLSSKLFKTNDGVIINMTKLENEKMYKVYNNANIYLLGSKKDIEGFKKYISKTK